METNGCLEEKLTLENGCQLCEVDMIGSKLAKTCEHQYSLNKLYGPPYNGLNVCTSPLRSSLYSIALSG